MPIAFLGRPGWIPGFHRLDTATLYRACGDNTGNLAFWFAAWNQFVGEREVVEWTADPDMLRERYDRLFFCAANQVNPQWDFGDLAETIRKADLPVVVVGLGAQAPEVGQPITLKPGTRRLLQVLADLGEGLGVRGEYTADVLRQIGIHNTRVIGCPSNFINLDPQLGHRNHHSARRAVTSLVVNDNDAQHLVEGTRSVRQRIGARSEHHVVQSGADLIRLTRKEFRQAGPEVLAAFRDRYCPEATTDEFTVELIERFHVFFSCAQWLEFLRGFDLSIGTRIHGNLLAWQAGVPAIVFPHDSRTFELADTLRFPRVPFRELKYVRSFDDLINKAGFDGNAYDERRRELAGRYCALLTDSGLEVVPELLRFAGSPRPA